MITPDCCPDSKKLMAVGLKHDGHLMDDDCGTSKKPNWCIKVYHVDGKEYLYEVRVEFCPFCGDELPDVERRPKPPKRLCVISDGGYYCDTCETSTGKKRLDACRC
jgi:hypothetical protein|tara:strand:+ start:324 stop:641 length:318 start_codon:yes stop_codon:yes gene_type:complete